MLVDDDLRDENVRTDDGGPQSGSSQQDRRWLTLAGGAGLVVLVLLVYAVLHTARSSTQPREVRFPGPAPSSTSGSTTPRSIPVTTSYSPPSAQTSLAGTTVGPIAPIETTPAESTREVPSSVTSDPTTIFNPYATTSVPNAGAF